MCVFCDSENKRPKTRQHGDFHGQRKWRKRLGVHFVASTAAPDSCHSVWLLIHFCELFSVSRKNFVLFVSKRGNWMPGDGIERDFVCRYVYVSREWVALHRFLVPEPAAAAHVTTSSTITCLSWDVSVNICVPGLSVWLSPAAFLLLCPSRQLEQSLHDSQCMFASVVVREYTSGGSVLSIGGQSCGATCTRDIYWNRRNACLVPCERSVWEPARRRNTPAHKLLAQSEVSPNKFTHEDRRLSVVESLVEEKTRNPLVWHKYWTHLVAPWLQEEPEWGGERSFK